jgi:hypothetical protein
VRAPARRAPVLGAARLHRRVELDDRAAQGPRHGWGTGGPSRDGHLDIAAKGGMRGSLRLAAKRRLGVARQRQRELALRLDLCAKGVLDRLGRQPRAMHDTAQPHARRTAEREAVAHDLDRVAELRLGGGNGVDP